MGVARFTEVPTSLEELGTGMTSRVAVWALTIASGVADVLESFEPFSHANNTNATFGARLDSAVGAAANPGAAPTVLLALAVFVWLLRQAAVAVHAAGLVRASLDADGPAGEPKGPKAE